MLAFAESPHGLGIAAEDFWRSTPRELAAKRKVFDQSREFFQSLHASIQATLHNAHWLTEKGQKPFTPQMFMPGYVSEREAKPDWRKDLEGFKSQFAPAKPDPGMLQVSREIEGRMKKAAAARAQGATSEQLRNIMNGVL